MNKNNDEIVFILIVLGVSRATVFPSLDNINNDLLYMFLFCAFVEDL